MKTSLKRLLCLVLPSLLSYAYGVFPTKASAETAPYIYYYSAERKAFVVERADGSDSFTLAPYTFNNDNVTITGPGWSASKQWFAWTSETADGPRGNQNAYIVDRTGKVTYTVFSNYVQVTAMSWSPVSDLLMVAFYDSLGQSDEKVLIYSPATNKVLTTLTAGFSFAPSPPGADPYFFNRAYWSPDGQYVFLVAGKHITLFYPTGKTRVIETSLSNLGSDWCGLGGTLPHQFGNGNIAYLDARTQTLDIQNAEGVLQTSIELPAGKISYVDWHSDDNYALIYLYSTDIQPKLQLWLLSLQTKTIERLSDDVYVYFAVGCNTPYDKTVWNAKDQGAFISAQYELWLVDAPTKKLTKISPTKNGTIWQLSPLRWTKDGNLLFVWKDGNSSAIYSYNPLLDKTSLVETSSSYFAPMVGDYLIYNSDDIVVTNTRTNVQTRITYQPPTRYASIYDWEALPHPTEKWLFILSENIDEEHLISVANYDGTIQRYLALCPITSQSCFGWL